MSQIEKQEEIKTYGYAEFLELYEFIKPKLKFLYVPRKISKERKELSLTLIAKNLAILIQVREVENLFKEQVGKIHNEINLFTGYNECPNSLLEYSYKQSSFCLKNSDLIFYEKDDVLNNDTIILLRDYGVFVNLIKNNYEELKGVKI